MDGQIIFVTEPLRRRKRVAKACTSCHVSKRRCDGGSPCYNCHIAHKVCIYLDASRKSLSRGQKRASSPSDATSSLGETSRSSATPSTPHGWRKNRLDDWDAQAHNQALRASIESSVVFEQRLGADPQLVSELLKLFFIHCYPHDEMFHSPTFTADVAAGRVPSFLTKAVLALAAPFSAHPDILQVSSVSPKWQMGARFADEALAELVDPRTGEIRYTAHEGLELEIAQACCILYCHSTISRQQTLQAFQQGRLLHKALWLLVRLGVPDWDVVDPTGQAQLDKNHVPNLSRAQWRRRECFRRTLWVVHCYNILACATTLNDMRFRELEVKIFLPNDQGVFEYGMETTSFSKGPSSPSIRTPLSSTSIPIHSGQLIVYPGKQVASDGRASSVPRPGQTHISEFGHLLRLLVVYGRVMAALGRVRDYLQGNRGSDGRPRKGRNGEDIEETCADCLLSLQQWEGSLPRRLELNESNMKMHMLNLQRSVGNGPWPWVLMHGLAGCCVLVLHEIIDELRIRPKESHSLPQRHVAYETLLRILDNAGTFSRSYASSGLMLLHLGPPLLRATPEAIEQTINSDSRVKRFFREYEENFGVSHSDLCSLDFRLQWTRQASEASPFIMDIDPERFQPLPSTPPPHSTRHKGQGPAMQDDPHLRHTLVRPTNVPSSSSVPSAVHTTPKHIYGKSSTLHVPFSLRAYGHPSQEPTYPFATTTSAAKDKGVLPSIFAETQQRQLARSPSLTLPPLVARNVHERATQPVQPKEASTTGSPPESGPARHSRRPPKGMPWLQDAIG